MHSAVIKLKQIEKALSISDRRWTTLVQAIPVGIFLTDINGNYLYVNHLWAKIAAIPVEKAYGQCWLNLLHSQDRDLFYADWIERKKNNLPFSFEYQLNKLHKKFGLVFIKVVPEKTVDGTVVGYMGTIIDITEKWKIKEMKQSLEKEKKKSERKLLFFSMTAHEIRTPLSIIKCSAQILENSEPEWLDTKKTRNIHRIKGSVKKINQMLTDLLMLARAETNKLTLKPTRINLRQFCQQTLKEIKSERQEDCNISFIYKENLNNEVYLDEKLLHSILFNLLSNAIKYSPQGEVVNFDVKYLDESFVFTIQDQGIGIPLQDQAHLFETFYRGENVGRIDGTGLGLAIVKRCVDVLGGEITFESVPEIGTIFIVSIPITVK